MVEVSVKISKKKNGLENVFLNTKGTKKIIHVKVKSERKGRRDCAYECNERCGERKSQRKRYERA